LLAGEAGTAACGGCSIPSLPGARRSLLRAATLALALLPPSPDLAVALDAAPGRFSAEAALRPLSASACGRFAIQASVRHATEARSADGRFALKVVNTPAVGCDAFPDPVFANGFEAP
jgi:hypothetical protein